MIGVDYARLGRALQYYAREGYEVVDVPWIVSEAANRMTAPSDATLFRTHAGTLVASGEQALLQQLVNGKLRYDGAYVCCTPCFRDEPQYNWWYQQGFMKVELMIVSEVDFTAVLVAQAARFMQGERAGSAGRIQSVKTNDGVDLMLNGIEVGSYGHRTVNGFTWTYGTGLAEPRFTRAMWLG